MQLFAMTKWLTIAVENQDVIPPLSECQTERDCFVESFIMIIPLAPSEMERVL
jgi:hypothetical protein